eukprot:scaffold25081_cov48-Phaeocystis_antarctica.AAC.2
MAPSRFYQRQRMPRPAPRCGPPRPISRLGPRWHPGRPNRLWYRHGLGLGLGLGFDMGCARATGGARGAVRGGRGCRPAARRASA